MYHICFIVPMFNPDLKEEERRRMSFKDWTEKSLKPAIKGMFGEKECKVEFLLACTGEQDIINGLQIKYEGMTQKGLMVRSKILSVIDKIDVVDREQSFVVLIDGSGKIDYNCALGVIGALVNGENIVLGCRHKGSFGIPDDRKNIEIFENFLVSEKFKIKLPDAQCGCWGLRANLLKRLSLTAVGYEIELDLLVSALEARIDICFFPVKIIESATKISSFDPSYHIDKLKFLLNKLSFDEFMLKALFEKFKIKFEMPLPESYVAGFSKIVLDYHKVNPKCFSGCDTPCTDIIKPSLANEIQL